MMQTSSNTDVRRVLAEIERGELEAETNELAIHPFPARMPFSVAQYLVERLSAPGEIVLDPMVGSGTTLVVAKRTGRRAVGFDRDPLAVLLTRAATQSLERTRLESLESFVLNRAQELFDEMCLPETRGALTREDQEFLRYWFPPRSQKQLFALAAAVGELPDASDRDFAWLVFSSLVIAKSSGASLAVDIPRSRPHKRAEKRIVLPFEGWRLRFRAALKRHSFVDCDAKDSVEVHSGDARSLPLSDEAIDFVLTSPPYVTAIDYLRAHKFSLVWMGHELETLRELRGTMIGTERGLWVRDGLPPQIEKQLEEAYGASRRKAILRRYLSDLRRTAMEIRRVLRPGRLAVLVVGPSMIGAGGHDAVDVVSQIAESLGLEVVANATRSIGPARRSLPPPRLDKATPLDLRMREEVLIALRK